MAKKTEKTIILFLSALHNPSSEEFIYEDDAGNCFLGQQTNQAPVLSLLSAYPETTTILAIVTPLANETAWEPFCTAIAQHHPHVKCTQIPMADGEDFQQGPLDTLLNAISDHHQVLLDTTGGFRNAIMYLMFIVRVLSLRNIPLLKAVFSDHYHHQILDITSMFRLFDLVGGMQELVHLGNVQTLRAYYKTQKPDPYMEALLTAMEDLSEALTLCRTKVIDAKVAALDQAIQQGKESQEPLLHHLLPAFQQKFGRKLTTPGIVKWCVDSDMLQQALTVYTERMPAYLIKSNILSPLPNAPRPIATKSYVDYETSLFLDGFLLTYQSPLVAFRALLESPMPVSTSPDLRRGLANLELLLNLAYPTQTDYDPQWVTRLPSHKQALAQFDIYWSNIPPCTSKERMQKHASKLPTALLYLLLEQTPPAYSDDRIATIEHIHCVQQHYRLNRPLPQIQTICQDYLYIKAIRNMTNHANHHATNDQKYFLALGYPNLDTLTSQDVKHILRTALDNLRQA